MEPRCLTISIRVAGQKFESGCDFKSSRVVHSGCALRWTHRAHQGLLERGDVGPLPVM
jgi:hypothetical protein